MSQVPPLETLDSEDYIPYKYWEGFFTVGIILTPAFVISFLAMMAGMFWITPLFLVTLSGPILLLLRNRYVKERKRKHLKNAERLRPPHKVIDNFVNWEKGDLLKYNPDGFHMSYDEIPHYFMGTLEDGSIILMDRSSPDWVENIARVSADFLVDELNAENERLKERIKENQIEATSKKISESEYEEFRKIMKSEYEKLSQDSTNKNKLTEDRLNKVPKGEKSF